VEFTLRNDLSELDRVSQRVNEFGAHQRLGPQVLHDLDLALEEVLANIISYGYTDVREHEIRVSLSVHSGQVRVDVEDDGQPFNPLEAPAPDTAKPVNERSVGGLGIHLVRQLMDGLEYKRAGDRNLLTMKKTTQQP
jgi:serine/threonine-protein kinase RsbW